jgi:hypothetical protein
LLINLFKWGVVYLGRFLGFIKGIFRPITLVGSSIDVLISRGVLVPLASITILLIIVNNVCKYIFIWFIVS